MLFFLVYSHVASAVAIHKIDAVHLKSLAETRRLRPRRLVSYPSKSCTTIPSHDHLSQGGENCVFPFTHAGTVYHQCTTAHNDGVAWCATEVDAGGGFRTHKWGYCSPQCKGYMPEYKPTTEPTPAFTYSPTPAPTTAEPTTQPSAEPTTRPTARPTAQSTAAPTAMPTSSSAEPLCVSYGRNERDLVQDGDPCWVYDSADGNSSPVACCGHPSSSCNVQGKGRPGKFVGEKQQGICVVSSTTAPTAVPISTPISPPTLVHSLSPTSWPTAKSNAEPTASPTARPHPCESGQNTCAPPSEGGICIRDGDFTYICQCQRGFQCTAGCGNGIAQVPHDDLGGLIPLRRLQQGRVHQCERWEE